MHFRHYRGDKPPRFAHPVEEELAELLDEEGIPWQYEPHTFPLERGPDGTVHEAITPDFYLPEADAYIECTTMKQKNVSKKNRKVRKLRERYGEVVTVLYRRDFQRLRDKYRREPASVGAAGAAPTENES